MGMISRNAKTDFVLNIRWQLGSIRVESGSRGTTGSDGGYVDAIKQKGHRGSGMLML